MISVDGFQIKISDLSDLKRVDELTPNDGDVLVFIEEDGEVSCLGIFLFNDDGCFTDDQDFNFTPKELNCLGWLPKPVFVVDTKI